MPALQFDQVDVIFGKNYFPSLEMLDQGQGRDEIYDKTGNIVAVHNASLFAEKGEILVLMGLSGSGKSSLIRCVNGLNQVTRGHVWVELDDQRVDMAHCPPDTLRMLRRNRISMVFQQFGLMPWLNVRQNVGFGLNVRGLDRASQDKIVSEKLELVRLDRWADKYPHELSGGMQQRVGLARALATEADILLMDEPFSALDPLIREHLQDELMELQQRLRKTIVFVSHDLNEALKIGSRIAIMEAGKVVQFGKPADIVLHPTNEYVRQFMASMNPLAVLRAEMLMRPLEECKREGDLIHLDDSWQSRLDASGRPLVTIVNGKSHTPFTASLHYSMREAVLHYETNGTPILICDAQGEMVGVITAKELYRGLLRSSSVGA